MGRDWRGGRLTGRAAAGLVAGDALGDLSKMLFALAGKKAEEERKAAEKAAMTSKEMLPFLKLQLQLQRQQQLDQRHAEERKVDLEFRQNQATLAERAAARQDEALKQTVRRNDIYEKQGLPAGVSMRAAASTTASTIARNEASMDEPITDPAKLSQIRGAEMGITPRQVRARGLTIESPKQQSAKIALAAKIALLDRFEESVKTRLPVLDTTPGAMKRLDNARVMATTHIDNFKLATVDGDPDANFLTSLSGHLDKLKAVGSGAVTEEDVKRYKSILIPGSFDGQQAALAKAQNLRRLLMSEAKALRVPLADIIPDVEEFKGTTFRGGLDESPAPAAAPTVPAPSVTTTPTTSTTTTTANPVDVDAALQRLQRGQY